jgi:hypothetical protein
MGDMTAITHVIFFTFMEEGGGWFAACEAKGEELHRWGPFPNEATAVTVCAEAKRRGQKIADRFWQGERRSWEGLKQ